MEVNPPNVHNSQCFHLVISEYLDLTLFKLRHADISLDEKTLKLTELILAF